MRPWKRSSLRKPRRCSIQRGDRDLEAAKQLEEVAQSGSFQPLPQGRKRRLKYTRLTYAEAGVVFPPSRRVRREGAECSKRSGGLPRRFGNASRRGGLSQCRDSYTRAAIREQTETGSPKSIPL